ncbi:Unknown protein [Striga hermonthica]|uniref:Uncharacterized protein n=1 Tax=Striga hermonthica TaxID=68872 RepID=A0A9N7RLW6_STRHE|nr:Unknown protein [Striga hermonthica]
MGRARSNNSSSSGEEDGDAEWRAAIDSVTASTATFTKQDPGGPPASSVRHGTREGEDGKQKPQKLKHYQIKAQKLLEDMLDKEIEVVSYTTDSVDENGAFNDVGVRLFRRAPAGIVFDRLDEHQGPKKKPRIIPGEVLGETSKEFRKQLKSAAVDGANIIAAAKTAREKSLAKLEAREGAAKAAREREEQRVAELKRIRGERWLPSIARQMRVTTQRKK